jgi:nucleotide-binding universal stress UspA family protein
MNKILVPCDFSEVSNNALNYAIEIAKYFSGNIVLLHVSQIPVMNSEFGMTPYSFLEIEKENKKSLEDLKEQIKKEHPLLNNIECHLASGNLVDTITEYTSAHNIDMVIMGISGHGNSVLKLFFGSTAVSVSKKTKTPLLIVPPSYTFKKINAIAFACDYDIDIETSTSLLQVNNLKKILGSELQILHVVPENHSLNYQESEIDCFVEKKLENSPHRTFMISENKVSDGLIEYAATHKVDLLIIEPKKHNFLFNLFLNSTTDNVAFYSQVPLLTIHG